MYDYFCQILFISTQFFITVICLKEVYTTRKKDATVSSCLNVATGLPPTGYCGRAPGQGFQGAKPQMLQVFCFTYFWGTRRDQTLSVKLTHDGSKWAESHNEVPFGLKILNVVLATGRQTTITVTKFKQQFYCQFFVTMDNSRPKKKQKKYKLVDWNKRFFSGEGVGISPLWMPMINTG